MMEMVLIVADAVARRGAPATGETVGSQRDGDLPS
jgi:hypothetical protein